MQYKKIIVRIILLSAVIAGVTDLFTANPQALWAMVAVYFCIPLASLTLTTSSKARIIVIATIISLLVLLVSRFKVYSLIAVAVFIGGTAYCIIQHNIRIHRRKEITTRALAYVHSGIFALVCAIAGTFSIMSKPEIFNTITCDQVRSVVNQHLSTVLTPLRFTEEQIGSIQVWVDRFFTQSPEQVVQDQVMGQLTNNPAIADILPSNITQQLGSQGINDLQKTVTDMLKNNGGDINLSNIQLPATMSIKDKLMAKEILKNANLNKQVPKLTIGQNTLADTTPTTPAKPQTLPQQTQATESTSLFNGLLTNSLDNKQQLDEKICDVVFSQIRERSTKPGFKISILLSLIFFLYPLGRLLTFVYSIILKIIYILLRQTGFISVIPEEKIVDTWTISNGYEPQTLLARMAFSSNKDTTSKSERIAKVIATQEIARNATPPIINTHNNTSKKGSNVNDIMGDVEQLGGGTGVMGDNHIITANSVQDTDEEEQPQPKKDTGPHIDFGSFGGNFGQKFKNE